MEKIKDYDIIEELELFGDGIKLWLAKNNSGIEFEILTIEASNEFNNKIDRVLKNEIAPLVDRKISGVQEIIKLDFDNENNVNYIVYKNSREDFVEISDFNKQNLLILLNILNNLKKENRFGFVLSPKTVLLNQNNDILLKFIGLFEVFSLFNALPKDYLSPELLDNKKPKLQDDIFSIGKLFSEYLSPEISLDKRLAEKGYKKYPEFIEEIKRLPRSILPNRKSICVKTQPKYEDKFEPIIQEMNELCYWTIEANKSKKDEQITGQFSTKRYSGRYFVDDQNYIFVPYLDSLNGGNENIKKEGQIAVYNFISSPVDDFNCFSFFETEFEQNNKLVLLNSQKRDVVKKWQTPPEKEKEFIEEKAFKAPYLKREDSKSNDLNIVFQLEEGLNIDWGKIKELKNKSVDLFIGDDKIGEILDFDQNVNFIIIKDSKRTIDEIPESGELVENVRQETSQFKKQVEACVKFEDRDIVNPDIAGILATPEKMPLLNRIDIDYDEFENRIENDYLKNDESQKKAVLEAMNKRPVYLIQGPPGTGKNNSNC